MLKQNESKLINVTMRLSDKSFTKASDYLPIFERLCNDGYWRGMEYDQFGKKIKG